MRGVPLILGALVIAVAGLAWGLWSTIGALSAAEATIGSQADQIEQLRASQARTAASLAALAKKSQQTRVEVQRALDETPEYRDAPVPPAVVDGLCKRLKCAQ